MKKKILSLDELKKKWFLSFEDESSSLDRRAVGTKLQSFTDNNFVTVPGEGSNYMESYWFDVKAIAGTRTRGTDRPNSQVYGASWKSDNVAMLHSPRRHTPDKALDFLVWAKRRGVDVYSLICSNLGNDIPLPGLAINRQAVAYLMKRGVPAALDRRYPAFGSNHQKIIVDKMYEEKKHKIKHAGAYLGSIDINQDRWDTIKHDKKRLSGTRVPGFPTHEVGVHISGPAIADVEWTFLERWNDKSRRRGMHLPLTVKRKGLPSKITPMVENYPKSGLHSVQVLRTYGIPTRRDRNYFSWAKKGGEFTIWAAYLHAIKQATHYIYIEDQYFFASGIPPSHRRANKNARETDIIYQLGEAIKRGVKVAVLFPMNTLEPKFADPAMRYQRNIAIKYLYDLAKTSSKGGDFFAAYLYNYTTNTNIYVHSKVMILDDEYALIGSANINQRSMTCDSEIQIGVLDKKNEYAKRLRKNLFKEHTGQAEDDPIKAYEHYKKISQIKPQHANTKHRVVYFAPPFIGKRPKMSKKVSFRMIDPYRGPKTIRKN